MLHVHDVVEEESAQELLMPSDEVFFAIICDVSGCNLLTTDPDWTLFTNINELLLVSSCPEQISVVLGFNLVQHDIVVVIPILFWTKLELGVKLFVENYRMRFIFKVRFAYDIRDGEVDLVQQLFLHLAGIAVRIAFNIAHRYLNVSVVPVF